MSKVITENAMNKRILVLSNNDIGLYSFRKELLEKLIKQGYEVIISLPNGKRVHDLINVGCKFIDTKIDRRGINISKDFKLFFEYAKILKEVEPNVVLTYTIKPNVYGSFACQIFKIPYINNVTGLGSGFTSDNIIKSILIKLQKLAYKKSKCVFFQNNGNKEYFNKVGIAVNNSYLLPGSGVNLDYHSFNEYPKESSVIKFIFIGRIMEEKGVEVLLNAVKIVNKKYTNCHFSLIGQFEKGYENRFKEINKENFLKYIGIKPDVRPFIKESNCLINPSYHEGLSNVLLEAAANGRPVIASNISGCKETFDEGISGFGFEVKNDIDLANKIIKFIELSYKEKENMGIAGRAKVEKEFNRDIVVNNYLRKIKEII